MSSKQGKLNRKRRALPRQRFLPKVLYGENPRDILFAPDATEIELERQLRRQMQFRAEAQRDWLQEQTRRLAKVAMELDETQRMIELQKLQDRQDAWHEAEAAENAKILAAHQEDLDRPTLLKRQKQLAAAAKDIHRQNCEIERDRLARKGLIRGHRVRNRSNVETRC
jgi:hypothetical protein